MEIVREDRWSKKFTIRNGGWSASVIVSDELIPGVPDADQMHLIRLALLESIRDKVFRTGYT